MMPSSTDLLALAPADRFLAAASARGLSWRASRPDQWYGQCPGHDDVNGSAGLGVDDDGTALFTCFAGCRALDVLEVLGLRRDALFARGSRGPAVDHMARERMIQADQRAFALQASQKLLDLVDELEKIPPRALAEFGIGLVVDRGLSILERDHRGRGTAVQVLVPKGLRDRVDGPAKKIEPGGRRGVVYPLPGLIAGDDLLVVEGAFSAVAATTLGHQSLALPSASWSFPTSWARSFFRDRSVVLLPDADDRGRDAMERTAASALKAGARSVGIVDLHGDLDDGRDLADDLREHGPEAAGQMLANAIGRTTFTQPERSPRGGRPPKSIAAAEAYLREVLGDGRWHEVSAVNDGAPSSVSARTLETARRNLGVESQKFGRTWQVRAPPT